MWRVRIFARRLRKFKVPETLRGIRSSRGRMSCDGAPQRRSDRGRRTAPAAACPIAPLALRAEAKAAFRAAVGGALDDAPGRERFVVSVSAFAEKSGPELHTMSLSVDDPSLP